MINFIVQALQLVRLAFDSCLLLFTTQFNSRFYFGHKTAKKRQTTLLMLQMWRWRWTTANNRLKKSKLDHDVRWWLYFLKFFFCVLFLFIFCTDAVDIFVAFQCYVAAHSVGYIYLFILYKFRMTLFTFELWRKCAIYICDMHKTHLKSKRLCEEKIKKNDRFVSFIRVYNKQQCNVWCIAFMDHVKVDVKSMRSSVSLESSGFSFFCLLGIIKSYVCAIWVGKRTRYAGYLFFFWLFWLFSFTSCIIYIKGFGKLPLKQYKIEIESFFFFLCIIFLLFVTHIKEQHRGAATELKLDLQ